MTGKAVSLGTALPAGALPLLIRRLAHGGEDVRLAALELLLELAELNLPITGACRSSRPWPSLLQLPPCPRCSCCTQQAAGAEHSVL